jgi:hypothetical protein
MTAIGVHARNPATRRLALTDRCIERDRERWSITDGEQSSGSEVRRDVDDVEAVEFDRTPQFSRYPSTGHESSPVVRIETPGE